MLSFHSYIENTPYLSNISMMISNILQKFIFLFSELRRLTLNKFLTLNLLLLQFNHAVEYDYCGDAIQAYLSLLNCYSLIILFNCWPWWSIFIAYNCSESIWNSTLFRNIQTINTRATWQKPWIFRYHFHLSIE